MKSIQARLQSRIAHRANFITILEHNRQEAIANRCWGWLDDYDYELRRLREDQVLDKQIISSIYWRSF